MKFIRTGKKRGYVESFISTITFIPCILISFFTSPYFGVILFFVFNYLNIYIHELGHVLVGKLLNFKIRSIIIGDGKLLLYKNIFGIPFVLKTGNIGSIVATINCRRCFKLRRSIFVSGGLLMHLLFVIILTLFRIRVNIITVFVISNIFLFINNVFPMNVYRNGEKIPTDGLLLVKIPLMKEKDIVECLAVHKMYEAFDLLSRHVFGTKNFNKLY